MLVIVTRVIMTLVGMIVIGGVVEAVIRRLGRVWLWIVFDCVCGTQRCAFHALYAPNKMPEWGTNCLFWDK
jgi:hypothetical protein